MEEWSHRAARPLAWLGCWWLALGFLLPSVLAQATDPFRIRSRNFFLVLAIKHTGTLMTDCRLVLGLVRER